MTNIRSLPLVKVEIETGTNEDWLDALQFLDAASSPVSLAGIDFASILRTSPKAVSGYALAATTPTYEGLQAVGDLVVGGVGDSVLAWSVPEEAMRLVPPGTYVLDVVAIAEGTQIRVVTGAVTVVQGITRR